MKSTPTLCKLLIFIICVCILLSCFKSFFLLVLLLCFPAVLAHFVRHFPLARGWFYFFSPTMFYFRKFRVRAFLSLDLFSTKVVPQYRLFFLYLVCFLCFRISAPQNQFQTQKIVNKLYCFIIFF